MPTLHPVDGSSDPAENSYVAAEVAEEFFAGHLYADHWQAASEERRTRGLIMATEVIEAEWRFFGAKAVAAQALAWPRLGCPDPDGPPGATLDAAYARGEWVPRGVLHATCQLALRLMQRDRTEDPPGEGIFSEWTEFSGKKYEPTSRRPLLPVWVRDYLLKYGVPARGAAVVKLTRV